MKKLSLVLIVSLLISGVLFAAKPALSEETKALLKEAKTKTKSISAQNMKKMMAKEEVILLDVRDPDEWKKSTIEYDKQVKISRGFLEIKYPKLILEKYTKDDTYIVYCALEPRSVFAAKRLQELGFKNVLYLKGGQKKLKKSVDCSKVAGPLSL